MTTGLVYGVAGKMFIGPITAVNGAGGVEIKGVEGRSFIFDTGLVLERTKDQVHHDIIAKPIGPGLLDVPMHDVDDDAVKEQLRTLWDSTGFRPGVQTNYVKIPSNAILILPTAASDSAGNPIKVIYLKAAKLDPDTQTSYNFSLDAPLFAGVTRFMATSVEGDDEKDPWMIDIPSAITTHYF